MSRWFRAGAGLVALLVLVIGVPLILIRTAGWPLPSELPEFTNVVTRLRQGNIDSDVVINTLAVIVWIAWAQFMWAVLWETIVNIPRLMSGRLTQPPPLVLSPVGDGVARLFSVILAVGLLSTTTNSSVATALTVPSGPATVDAPTTLVLDADDVSGAEASPSQSTSTRAKPTWLTVADDDLWGIAETALGDGSRVDDILVLNPGLTARSLRPGVIIELPDDATVPTDRVASETLTVDSDADAAAFAPAADSAATETSNTPEATSGTFAYVVQPNDGMWHVSEALLGDGSRHAEAADLLDGQEVAPGEFFDAGAAVIHPGWVFTLDQTAPPAIASQHVVVDGESLSSIAENHFGESDRWEELWSLNGGNTMNDGRVFDDPNLILPGWNLLLAEPASTLDAPAVDDVPAPADDAVAPEAPATVEPEAVESATVGSDVGLPAPVGESVDSPTEAPVVDIAVPGASPRPTSPPAWPDDVAGVASTSTSTSVPAASGGAASSDPNSDPAPSAPAPIRAQHAGLLAAGILALVGVRRRQRLRSATPRTRVPEPRPGVVATERQLRTIDSGERATRVDVAIRAAAHALVDTDAQVGFALLGLDGDIELRISRPAVLPPPWQPGSDDSQTWLLAAATPVELLAEAARRVGTPCVALVQLGVSGHRDVIIDLEACGTLAVDATGALADQIVTAIATSLATSPYAEISHLITVSLSERCVLGHRNAHRAPSATKALQLAASLVGSTRASDRTSFSLRSLRTGGEMWEPAIVLLAAADQLDTHSSVDLPPPGHGVGVVGTVAPGALRAAPARLIGQPDRWELVAFGASIVVEPVGISNDDLDELAALLDDAATPLAASDETTLTADELARSRPAATSGDDDEVHGDDDEIASDDSATPSRPEQLIVFEPRDHRILVRLMGGVDVMSYDGRPGSFERSKTVELIAWLATHRHASTRAAARTALWELDVRDATFANVVSESRRALGRLVTPPGDDEWVGRTLTEQLPLHEGVVTDADLIEERLAAARVQSPDQAIDTLRPAAEMIRDMPFAGTSYLWPDAEGITSNLVLLATSVTTELAGHALSLGDTDTVFWATGQGLKVLAGHEELIGLRMRAHARAGDLAGVRQEWESYERVIVADAWSDGEPAPKLLELRRKLLTSPT